ncbi:MAG: methyltransferase domain-containing protein [Solirubrobacterales bacterium]
MHLATYEKIRQFRDVYLRDRSSVIKVLDVGSWTREGQLAARAIFEPRGFNYVGLDLVQGPNVDMVPNDPYSWSEIETESIDVVISSSTFEHNPYFWITMAEISRVLAPGGLICLVAPSCGRVHRYPLDCWRFYPDAGAALCAYSGLKLVESYVEQRSFRKRILSRVWWGDWMLIARKPTATSVEDYTRLAGIVATRTFVPGPTQSTGPVIERYEEDPMGGAGFANAIQKLRHPIQFARQRPPR